ncbi:aldo/keto reductase [Pontiella sulfatireligans]|uniref:General stress protein 69 n=1 Tax=Pontiella sulfatireligans TaxID=2750658 RepID=A0A6C2UNB5_9BACT|nr:aldo/keto reductase [Pontiella sulfatireligans]VGO21433.1 General stress protein 69 [Pontiella sulfatireligans]
MHGLSRRNFVVPMIGGAAAVVTCRASVPVAPPQIKLGSTGISMSRMGFGTGVKSGRKKSAMTRQGFEKFTGLFRHCYDRGINFFDLADWYGSHPYCREALRHIPREQVAIMTKLWWRTDSNNPGELSLEHRRRSAEAAVERFRYELQTDYLDIVLLHCLVKQDWVEEMKPYMDVLSEAKAKGQIKAVGVSCHDFGAMQTAAELPWVDVMLARLNPFGVKCDSSPEEVLALLQKAKANGKAIIGMKIYGEGQLVDKRDECMKYAQTCGAFDAMTIGAVSPEQVDENLALMAKYPAVRL